MKNFLLLLVIICSINVFSQNNEAVTKRYDDQYEFIGKYGTNDLALVLFRGKFGFIDKKGKEVIPLIYDDIKGRDVIKASGWSPTCLYVAAKKNQKWGLIDINNNMIVPFIYDDICSFSTFQYMIRAKRNDKYGTLDQNGNIVIPFEYEDIQDNFFWGSKDYPIYAKKQGKYGYIKDNNEVVIPFKYSSANSFYHDLAAVSISGQYGFINTSGDEVVSLQYDFSQDFSCGLAAVVNKGKVGFINTNGEVIIPFRYTPVYRTEGNKKLLDCEFCSAGVVLVKKMDKWGLIDIKGNELTEFKYDGCLSCRSTGDYSLRINYKLVFIDKWGNEYDTEERREMERERHLIKDAESGDAWAQYELGCLYYYAKDSKKNLDKAFELYYKAAKQGYHVAYFNVAYMLAQGQGTQINKIEAFAWYKKSAETGNMVAQYNLGLYYQYGYGSIKDKDKALYWYQKSAEQGYKYAKERIAELRRDNKPVPPPVNNLASLTWLTHETTTKQKDYSIKISVKSNSKIEAVSVYVNGVLTRGIIPVHNDGYNMRIDRTVVLNDGQNVIKVTVKNAAGTISKEKVVTYHKQGLATIDWLAFPAITKEKQFVVKAGVKSSSKIDSWTVSVNGIVERGINPVKNDGYTFTIEKNILLSEGSNTIKIEVKNAFGTYMEEKNVTYSPEKTTPTIQQKRIALVIGNANYRDVDKKLNNPLNDATDVSAKLESLGFTVIRSFDQTLQGMEAAIEDFGNRARNYDVALFYYAGHGIRCNGSNYLVPIDANLPEESFVKYNCTNANLVLDLMDKANCKMKIVILDACRNNPFARTWNRSAKSSGLDIMSAPKGTFIAFSTAPGYVAQDGEGRNSPYTAALLQTLDIPNLSITDFFQEVLERVALQTNERQIPWTSNSFRGKFIFNNK